MLVPPKASSHVQNTANHYMTKASVDLHGYLLYCPSLRQADSAWIPQGVLIAWVASSVSASAARKSGHFRALLGVKNQSFMALPRGPARRGLRQADGAAQAPDRHEKTDLDSEKGRRYRPGLGRW